MAPDSGSRRSLRTATATAGSAWTTLQSPAWCTASDPADAVHVDRAVVPGVSKLRAPERKALRFRMWGGASAADWAYGTYLLGALPVLDQTADEAAPDDPRHDAYLLAALSDLNQAVDEACEEGFQPPSDEALQNAERVLRAMYVLRRCRFEVYPTEDREIAVSVPGGHRRSVLVLCDSDGGVLCSVNLNGQHRRAVYDPESAARLPDGFVREALAELDE